MTHPVLHRVTGRIIERSRASRQAYLEAMRAQREDGPRRLALSCSNFAHGFAACPAQDKTDMKAGTKPNIAIVSAYNDMLSAHQPYEHFPDIIRDAAHQAGGLAQFAGGVPAMCDGITQGEPGMELSLFSRDVIALSTAVALSHNMFDGALCLGICDKIVPGLLIGALKFGHLPVAFVPGGPMPSGLPHDQKRAIRQRYAEGKASREELLEAEAETYHAPGTCTFYGTANSNQMLMEIMGLQLPGGSFVNPHTPLREALTRAVTTQIIANRDLPLMDVFDEKALVNGVVGLLATGGSTNHTIHLIAIAAAAGIQLNWDDFAELSQAVPLLTRVYPNGSADINHFHAAGGMPFLIHELLHAGLLHEDVHTICGPGLHRYTQEPFLDGDHVTWQPGAGNSEDSSVLRPCTKPFESHGGLVLLTGNLGRAIMKTSAIKEEQYVTEAPAAVFRSQEDVLIAFKNNALNRDVVIVVTHQGPAANGMPELHALMPALGALQDAGHRIALVTDGRLSGASGKIPAALHVTPECLRGGPLARVKDGDLIRLDANTGTLEVGISEDELASRSAEPHPHANPGCGRELFSTLREHVTGPEEGASFVVKPLH